MDFCEVLECANLIPCPTHRRDSPHKRLRELETSLTMEEVRRHTHKTDCWVVINSKVYDVSSFLTDHPGGPDILLDFAGQDASEFFENAGHGPKARRMMHTYCIGTLAPSLSSSSSSSSSTSSLPPLTVHVASASSPSLPTSPSTFSFSPSLLAALPSPNSPLATQSPSCSEWDRYAISSIPGLYYIHDFLPLDYSKNLTNLLHRTLEGKGSYQGISYKDGPRVSVFSARNAPPWLLDVLGKYHAAGLAPLQPSQVSVNMYPSASSLMVPHKDGSGAQALILTLENSAMLRFWPKKEAFPVAITSVYDKSELTGPPQDVLLMPGSLLVMTGEAFKDWVHGVEPSPADVLQETPSATHPATANFSHLQAADFRDGETFPRGSRISIVSWFGSRY